MMIKKTQTTETRLSSVDNGKGVGAGVRILDGKVVNVELAVNQNENSSLPAEYLLINLPGGLTQLLDLTDLCNELVAELSKIVSIDR